MKRQRWEFFPQLLMIVFVLVVSFQKTVNAADFNGSISSTSATVGDTVTVTVSLSSQATIGAYALSVSYDPNILEYVSGADGGGGGTLQLYNDYVNSKAKSYTLTFKTKSAGNAGLSLNAINAPCDSELNDMATNFSGGSVNVAAPVTYSSENRLAALNVSAVADDGTTQIIPLTPGFSADVTEYHISVGANISRLSLDAAASDGKAAVKVAGTIIDTGANTTTITVTAEDGSVRQYVIYTDKAAQQATVQETTEQEPTVEETTVEETTIEETSSGEMLQEETTATAVAVTNPLEVKIDQTSYLIAELIPEGTVLPEGYEVILADYNGIPVQVLQGLSTKLELMYLTNIETGVSDFFIFDKEKKTFAPYIALTVRQHVYALLDIPEDIKLPFSGEIGQEFKITPITVSGKTVDALNYGISDMYFVYAMNWNGVSGFYYYDAKEGTMLRYVKSALEQERTGVMTDLNYNLSQAEKDDLQQKIANRSLIIIVLAVLVFLLMIMMIIVALAGRKKGGAGNAQNSEKLRKQGTSAKGFGEKNTMTEEASESEEEDEKEEPPMESEAIDQAIDQILGSK